VHLGAEGYSFLLAVLSTFALFDMNPWLCSFTRWFSWVYQPIWGNNTVSDSTGLHKEIWLEDYMEHETINIKIFFPSHGRWAHDIEQNSEPEFRSCSKVSLGANLVEKYKPAAERTCILQHPGNPCVLW